MALGRIIACGLEPGLLLPLMAPRSSEGSLCMTNAAVARFWLSILSTRYRYPQPGILLAHDTPNRFKSPKTDLGTERFQKQPGWHPAAISLTFPSSCANRLRFHVQLFATRLFVFVRDVCLLLLASGVPSPSGVIFRLWLPLPGSRHHSRYFALAQGPDRIS